MMVAVPPLNARGPSLFLPCHLLVLCCLLALEAVGGNPSVHSVHSVHVAFGTPTLVGFANSTKRNGSAFWFPSISIPTGVPGRVAQHITLSGDGGGGCEHEGQPDQSCEQVRNWCPYP